VALVVPGSRDMGEESVDSLVLQSAVDCDSVSFKRDAEGKLTLISLG
jgi:hypothetical protein